MRWCIAVLVYVAVQGGLCNDCFANGTGRGGGEINRQRHLPAS